MLYARKVIAREEMENTRKTYDKARQELEAARDVYRIVREGVSQYNASESNTMVRATITGLILDVPVKVGSSVIQANTMNDGTTIAAGETPLIKRPQKIEKAKLRRGHKPSPFSVGVIEVTARGR